LSAPGACKISWVNDIWGAHAKQDKIGYEQFVFFKLSHIPEIYLPCHDHLGCPNSTKFGMDITHSAILHHKKIWKFLNFFTILNNFTVHGWEHLDLGAQTPRPVGDIQNGVVLSFVFVMLSPGNGTWSNFGLNEKETSQDIYAATWHFSRYEACSRCRRPCRHRQLYNFQSW
jgi:hypothetical protein